MKPIQLILVIIGMVLPIKLSAQSIISYSYDSAGNRTGRTTTVSQNVFAQTETAQPEIPDLFGRSLFAVNDSIRLRFINDQTEYNNTLSVWKQKPQEHKCLKEEYALNIVKYDWTNLFRVNNQYFQKMKEYEKSL